MAILTDKEQRQPFENSDEGISGVSSMKVLTSKTIAKQIEENINDFEQIAGLLNGVEQGLKILGNFSNLNWNVDILEMIFNQIPIYKYEFFKECIEYEGPGASILKELVTPERFYRVIRAQEVIANIMRNIGSYYLDHEIPVFILNKVIHFASPSPFEVTGNGNTKSKNNFIEGEFSFV